MLLYSFTCAFFFGFVGGHGRSHRISDTAILRIHNQYMLLKRDLPLFHCIIAPPFNDRAAEILRYVAQSQKYGPTFLYIFLERLFLNNFILVNYLEDRPEQLLNRKGCVEFFHHHFPTGVRTNTNMYT
jgi:hypothetical protein